MRDVVAHVIATTSWSARPAGMRGAGRVLVQPDQRGRAGAVRRSPRRSCWGCWGPPGAAGAPRGAWCRVALVEWVIHHQDVRRALGRPRVVPPERLVIALHWAMLGPDIGGLWRIRGVRVVATDLGFAAGIGPEGRGPAEALLMTIAGRRGVARSCPARAAKARSRIGRLDPRQPGQLRPGGEHHPLGDQVAQRAARAAVGGATCPSSGWQPDPRAVPGRPRSASRRPASIPSSQPRARDRSAALVPGWWTARFPGGCRRGR